MIKKTIAFITYTLCILMFVWIGGSFIDIVSDNLDTNPQHSEYNFFVLALELNED